MARLSDIIPRPLGPTLVRLAIASVCVGLILSFLNIDPADLWRDLFGTIETVINRVYEFGEWAAKYLLLGAIVVIPIWLLARLWRVFIDKGGAKKGSDAPPPPPPAR